MRHPPHRLIRQRPRGMGLRLVRKPVTGQLRLRLQQTRVHPAVDRFKRHSTWECRLDQLEPAGRTLKDRIMKRRKRIQELQIQNQRNAGRSWMG